MFTNIVKSQSHTSQTQRTTPMRQSNDEFEWSHFEAVLNTYYTLCSRTTHTENEYQYHICILLIHHPRIKTSAHPLYPRLKPWGANSKLAHHDEIT